MHPYHLTCRSGPFNKTRYYTLHDSYIEWRDDKSNNGRISLSEITCLQLRKAGSPAGKNKFIATIYFGRRKVTIGNLLYQGFAEYSAQNNEYRDFITALCRRLTDAVPEATMISGDKPSVYRGYKFLTLAAIAVLLGISWMMHQMQMPEFIAFKLLLLCLYLYNMKRYMADNKPGVLNGMQLDDTFLPSAH